MHIEENDKIELLKAKFEKLRQEIDNALNLIEGDHQVSKQQVDSLERIAKKVGKSMDDGDDKIIEGVFDGVQMIGPDGEKYSVPENYASKSKLIEGDILKLTIQSDGKIVYKQIGPHARTRLRGTLIQDEDTSEFFAMADGKIYQVLLASVTYFKGAVGDDVIIVIPQNKKSGWAAIENIIKKGPGQTADEAVDQAMNDQGIKAVKDYRLDDDQNFLDL
ncbi:MAG: hypothetical protein WCX88_02040 [Patescibacteria group bacterium]